MGDGIAPTRPVKPTLTQATVNSDKVDTLTTYLQRAPTVAWLARVPIMSIGTGTTRLGLQRVVDFEAQIYFCAYAVSASRYQSNSV